MAKTEEVREEFCAWPYFVPYVFLRKIPRKKRAAKGAAKKPRKRKPRKASDL
jgi:hypothetical protein